MKSKITRLLAALFLGLVLIPASSAFAQALPGGFSFTTAGDYGASNNAKNVLKLINNLDPDFHIALGDLSYSELKPESKWCDFVKANVGSIPFLILSGNHESGGEEQDGDVAKFAQCLPFNLSTSLGGVYPEEYFFDYPKVNPVARIIMTPPHLIFKNGRTYDYSASGKDLIYVRDLIREAKAKNIPWIVVGMHKVCISTQKPDCEVGEEFPNMLINEGVNLVVDGHVHGYERTFPIKCMRARNPVGNCLGSSNQSSYEVRNGTIFATVGTGGVAIRPQDSNDKEVSYFATRFGKNNNPHHGVLEVSINSEKLQARFVDAVTGNAVDSFNMIKSTVTTSPSPTSPSAYSVNITSPNGGQTYQLGSSQRISFDSSNLPAGAISVASLVDGQNNITLGLGAASRGYLDVAFGEALAPRPYKVKVSIYERLVSVNCSGSDCGPKGFITSDESDGTISLTVSNLPVINVLSQSVSGSTVAIGGVLNIEFETSQSGMHTLQLVNNATGAISPLVTYNVTTTGRNTLPWVVRANNGTPGAAYKVRVCGYSTTASICDDSNATFNIVSAATSVSTVNITSPNGGQSYTVGSTQRISFNSSNIPSGAIAVVMLEGGPTTGMLSYGPASLGFVNVNLNTVKNGDVYTQTLPGNYRFKVSIYERVVSTGCTISTCGPQGLIVSDLSDATVTIGNSPTLPPVPSSVNISFPNGGDKLTVGSQYAITWTSAGDAAGKNVQIGIIDTRYNTEGGDRREQVIAHSIPNTGSYVWTVPERIGSMDLTVTPNPVYKIIVHSWQNTGSNQAVSDTSDTAFSISRVTAPLRNLPSVSYEGTPTLKLSVGRGGSEALLTYTAKVRVIGYNTKAYGLFNGPIIEKNGTVTNTSHNSTEVKIRNLSSREAVDRVEGVVIPANSDQTFEYSFTVNPKEMFAGTYRLALSGMYFGPESFTTFQGSLSEVSLPIVYSDRVTLVGETAPYITSVTPAVASNGTVELEVVRLPSSGRMYVSIDGRQFRVDRVDSDTVSFSAQSLGTTFSLGRHLVYLETNAGRTNTVGFEVNSTVVTHPTIGTCPLFVRNLTIGSEGSDVASLQNFLRAKGYTITEITAYFGQATRSALSAYQSNKGLYPADGYFGPLTRAMVNAECQPPTTPLSISVSFPSSVNAGSEHTISWASNNGDFATPTPGSTGGMGVYLVKSDGSETYLGLSNGTARNFTWTVPTSLSGYGFKIKLVRAGNTVGLSNEFSVNQQTTTGTPVITFPTLGTTLIRGAWYTIQWQNITSGSDVDIYLVNAAGSQTKITTVSGSQNAHQWTVPASSALGSYRIKIMKSGETLATSNYFAIAASAGETVTNKSLSLSMQSSFTKPSGDASLEIPYSWSANYSVERSWFQLINSSGEIKNAGSAGAYVAGSGATSRTMTFPAYLGTGTYTFKVCDVTTSAVTPSSVCTLVKTIQINQDEKSVQVIAPNGGQNYKVGDTIEIDWTYRGFPETQRVTIALFKNGSHVRNIATNVPIANDSTSWVISDGVYDSGAVYKIYVGAVDINGTRTDYSDSAFSISPRTESVKFTYPTSSSKLIRGAWYTIRWDNVPSSVYDVDLYFLQGGNETKITTVSHGQSSHQWTVPANTPVGTSNRIKVVNKATGQILATSDSFEVAASAGETVTNKSLSLSMQSSFTKPSGDASLEIPYSWSANYSVERSWFQLINSSGEIKNAGSAGAYVAGSGATSRTMTFPAYLGTGTYTFKVCDVTTSAVTPSSVCTETKTLTINPSATSAGSKENQTANIHAALQELLRQLQESLAR